MPSKEKIRRSVVSCCMLRFAFTHPKRNGPMSGLVFFNFNNMKKLASFGAWLPTGNYVIRGDRVYCSDK